MLGILAVVAVLAVGLGIYIGYYGLRPEPQPTPGPAPTPTPSPQPTPTPTPTVAESGCVGCHQALPQTFVGHTFADWQGSRHAQRGISCDDCHGGDPAQANEDLAHQGVRSSRDPESPLYFTRIPETCGRCHTAEFGFFRESVHYQRLQETGRGPNCVTCHGAMAIAVLRPRQLESTCTACHNERLGIRPDEPLKARFLLSLMNEASERLRLIDRLIRLLGPSIRTPAAEEHLDQARRELAQAQEAWHTFDLARVESQVERVLELARLAVEALEEEQPGGLREVPVP